MPGIARQTEDMVLGLRKVLIQQKDARVWIGAKGKGNKKSRMYQTAEDRIGES